MTANVSAASAGDVLLVFSEHGNHPALCKIARYFRERRGRVISITRHTSNPLRTLADLALVVSAHDELPYIQPLLYQRSEERRVGKGGVSQGSIRGSPNH